MEITVLGKSPAWQDIGGACSGYLVRDGDFVLLLDCGNGVFGKLREVCDYVDISAVLISHLHADHVLDLVPFSYALSYAPRQQPVPVDGWPGTEHRARPHLYAPPGAQEFFRRVVGCWGDEALIENAFALEEYEPGDELTLGPLAVRFCEVPHYTLTHAVDVRTSSGRRLTFSADCSPNYQLPTFARDTDMLLIEATLPRPERTGERGHLTSREAGEHALRARARRLVLTHFSDELDAERVLAEARDAFGSEVELATQGAVYTV